MKTMRKAAGWGTVLGLASGALALAAGRWAWQRRRAETLRGKVALITGGSRGLGHLLARLAGEEGARVVICARDAVELERARLNLVERGVDVLALPCDVSDPDDVRRLVAQAVRHFGAIDVLVNNAGVIQVGPLDDMRLEDFREAMDVNFWGGVHATLAALPYMRNQRSGRIVNITSIGGKIAMPHLLPYDCAKFAALGFSEGLRAELRKDRIAVVTVIPGLMRTGSSTSAVFKGNTEEEFTWFSGLARSHFFAMDARRAARRIVRAMASGDGEVVLGWQAKAARITKDLFPNLTTRMLALVDRVLPAEGSYVESASGRDVANARRLREFGEPAK
jgi:NAD(P)-dependent dehydrogenase (short-subunit alcohol dehydrogenase family)